MTGPACVVFDKTLTDYDFGPSHPMSPLRVDLTMRLAEELGVVGAHGSGLATVAAPVASDDLIATVHSGALIEAVMAMSRDPYQVDEMHGHRIVVARRRPPRAPMKVTGSFVDIPGDD